MPSQDLSSRCNPCVLATSRHSSKLNIDEHSLSIFGCSQPMLQSPQLSPQLFFFLLWSVKMGKGLGKGAGKGACSAGGAYQTKVQFLLLSCVFFCIDGHRSTSHQQEGECAGGAAAYVLCMEIIGSIVNIFPACCMCCLFPGCGCCCCKFFMSAITDPHSPVSFGQQVAVLC